MSDTPRAPIGPGRAARRAEAADRDRKAREYAEARKAAQTPTERAADDAERERLRQLVGTTVEWFSDPIPGHTYPDKETHE